MTAGVLAANAAEALLALGRTAEAAALIDPLTTGPPDRDHWLVHVLPRRDRPAARRHRRGRRAAAADQGRHRPHRQRSTSPARPRSGPRSCALWAGRPGDALEEVRRVLALFTATDLTDPLRAAAGGGHARLRRPGRAGPGAPRRARRRGPPLAAADGLAAWVERMGGAPFTDHPYVATIPAERATWDAERTRLAGARRPAARGTRAAKAWEDLGCPHRAGYAWWRHAEAQLDAGQPAAAAATALRAAAAAADGHAPLLAQIRALAERARDPAHPPPAAATRDAAAGRPTPLRADRPGAGGAAAAGRRAHQRPDRRRAVHQPQDRQRARDQHLAQARRLQPGAGRRRSPNAPACSAPGALSTAAPESKDSPGPNTARSPDPRRPALAASSGQDTTTSRGDRDEPDHPHDLMQARIADLHRPARPHQHRQQKAHPAICAPAGPSSPWWQEPWRSSQGHPPPLPSRSPHPATPAAPSHRQPVLNPATAGGMPGWQIVLIAAGSALVACALTLLAVRATRRAAPAQPTHA